MERNLPGGDDCCPGNGWPETSKGSAFQDDAIKHENTRENTGHSDIYRSFASFTTYSLYSLIQHIGVDTICQVLCYKFRL